MQKRLFTCIFLFIISLHCFSQTVLLEEDRTKDTVPTSFGPNLKNFLHFYLGYGFVAGPSEKGATINYGSSDRFIFGLRYKRKTGGVYSFGFDLNYHFTSFNLKQNAAKVLPDTILHKKEKFSEGALGFQLYNRINFDRKRGNYMGKFIDAGAGIDWFSLSHITKDKLPDGSLHSTSTRKLNYVNPVYYYAFLKLGLNRIIFSAGYRLSDLFSDDKNILVNGFPKPYPELPKLLVGIEIGFY
jgi:hypothetical protein